MFRLLILAAALLLPSCASIVSHGPDLVPITSTPSGAKVMRDGNHVGTTPCNILFRRSERDPFLLTLELDGHHNQEVTLKRSMNGWLFGNLVFGGIIGIIIDLASGNSEYLPARTVNVPLVAQDQPPKGPFDASKRMGEGKYGGFSIDEPTKPKEAKWATFAPADPK